VHQCVLPPRLGIEAARASSPAPHHRDSARAPATTYAAQLARAHPANIAPRAATTRTVMLAVATSAVPRARRRLDGFDASDARGHGGF
jgi:hypothetical protein